MNPDQNKSDQPTPEELLKMLDQELATQRKKRKNAPMRRALVLTVGILLIVGGTMVALLILRQMVEDMPRRPHAASTPAKKV